MNGNFASTPLSSNTSFNSTPSYGHYYPSSEPISPLEARFPTARNIGSIPTTQQMGQDIGHSYSPQYSMARSEVENQIALQQAQAECSRLKQQLVIFETQKLQQANQEKFSSNEGKRKRQLNAIRHYAQGFTFSTNLWTIEKAAVIVATAIPSDFDPQTRHGLVLRNPTLARKHTLHCFLWELNDYFPDECKHFMNNVKEMEQFLKYAQTLRSELQGHVQSNAAILLAEFGDITKEDYAEALDPNARATNQRFRQLLGYNPVPTTAQPQYPGLCPIISRDDDEFPFGTENIVKFLVIILFGKSQARADIPERHKGCNADNWGITEVTPNMVAVAATMIRYLVSPDRTFTTLGTISKIDWIATCSGYRNLLETNRETPGIVSLFEKLNSRLFGGRMAPVQQAPLPTTEEAIPTLFDASMQSAIASLQSRRAVSPVQEFARTLAPTPTPSIGMRHSSESLPPLQPATSEHASTLEDQNSAAFAEALIRKALDADSAISSDEDDSGDDENNNNDLISASTALPPKPTSRPCSRTSPNNLNLLATIASTARVPPASLLPTLQTTTTTGTTSAEGRKPKRKGQPDYIDLDENGEVDPPTPKKRKVVNNQQKKAGSNAKRGPKVGPGDKPPTARAKRTTATRPK